MKKERIERNLLFPGQQFRDRVRAAAKQRGFRTGSWLMAITIPG